jgi:hypothetical protein
MPHNSKTISYPRVLDESDIQRVNTFDVELTGQRIHEMAMINWCRSSFTLREGFPIPAIMSSPSEAFADFQNIAQQQQNSFSYLYNIKGPDGNPVYLPFPAPFRLPLITVKRDGWVFDNRRGFSFYWQRYAGWPSVSDDHVTPENGQTVGMPRQQLGTVFQQRRPAAYNYKFQLDHYANRPDTKAFFINQYMRSMSRFNSQPQVWIHCIYPQAFGHQVLLLRQEGDIINAEEEEPGLEKRIYRTTINLILEGWQPSLDTLKIPAFWIQTTNLELYGIPPQVTELYASVSTDLRSREENVIYDTATPMPTAPPLPVVIPPTTSSTSTGP